MGSWCRILSRDWRFTWATAGMKERVVCSGRRHWCKKNNKPARLSAPPGPVAHGAGGQNRTADLRITRLFQPPQSTWKTIPCLVPQGIPGRQRSRADSVAPPADTIWAPFGHHLGTIVPLSAGAFRHRTSTTARAARLTGTTSTFAAPDGICRKPPGQAPAASPALAHPPRLVAFPIRVGSHPDRTVLGAPAFVASNQTDTVSQAQASSIVYGGRPMGRCLIVKIMSKRAVDCVWKRSYDGFSITFGGKTHSVGRGPGKQ